MGLFNFNKKTEAPQEQVQTSDILDTIKMRNIDLPTPKEHRAFDWVLFGNHNSFPLELLEYKNSSSIHSAIIESKTSLIAGEGFVFGNTKEESDQYIIDNWKLVPFWRKLDKLYTQWITHVL